VEETSYYNQVARNKHPEVRDEWVARVLERPEYVQTKFVNGEHRRLLYGFIEEIDRWVLVILTEDDRLLNRHLDRGAMRRWGRPCRNPE
jgi:hypothetical protein